jgi:hypothetical protein
MRVKLEHLEDANNIKNRQCGVKLREETHRQD